MTTICSQQVLNYVLEKISKEFNINLDNLVEKYGSAETIYNAIQADIDMNKNNKKKVVRKVTKAVPDVVTVSETVQVADVVTPKKKVVRKVTKAVPVEVVVADVVTVSETVQVADVVTPKKKVVRKVTKAVPVEAVVADVVTPSVVIVSVEENSEEKVKPKSKTIVKKVTFTKGDISAPHKEVTEEPTIESGVDVCDELENNIYVDSQTYNDEDSDSLEPREINGVKYYIDTSNYVYHTETQDLIGKLNETCDTIIFLSDFSS
jgi:hypothetical protein